MSDQATPGLHPLDELFALRCRIALVAAALPQVGGGEERHILLGAEDVLTDAARDMEAIAKRIAKAGAA